MQVVILDWKGEKKIFLLSSLLALLHWLQQNFPNRRCGLCNSLIINYVLYFQQTVQKILHIFILNKLSGRENYLSAMGYVACLSVTTVGPRKNMTGPCPGSAHPNPLTFSRSRISTVRILWLSSLRGTFKFQSKERLKTRCWRLTQSSLSGKFLIYTCKLRWVGHALLHPHWDTLLPLKEALSRLITYLILKLLNLVFILVMLNNNGKLYFFTILHKSPTVFRKTKNPERKYRAWLTLFVIG